MVETPFSRRLAAPAAVPLRGLPVATLGLVFGSLAGLLLLGLVVEPGSGQQFVARYGLLAENLSWRPTTAWLSVITWHFLHGGASHFLANTVILLFAGAVLEARVGAPVVGLLWFIGGGITGLAHLVVAPGADLPLIGSSGGVSVLLGAVLVARWDARLPLPLGRGRRLVVPLWVPLLVWVTLQVIETARYLAGPATIPRVAYWSHLTGFLFGVAAVGGAMLLARRWPKNGSA